MRKLLKQVVRKMGDRAVNRPKKIEISKKKFAKKRNELNKNKINDNASPKVSPKLDQSASVDEPDNVQVKSEIIVKPVVPEPKKLELSNSFISRKFSQIYNKLSGSKENLNEPVNKTSPKFGLTRSLTLNSIQLKRHNRKSQIETKLEKLSEEKTSDQKNLSTPPLSPEIDTNGNSGKQICFPEPVKSEKPESISIKPGKLERSGSILSIIRRKISFHERKNSINSNWNASLQSLQQIDNMVDYDNLSFVNYDLFNNYESKLEKNLSQTDLTIKPKPPPSPLAQTQTFSTHPSLAPYPKKPLETINPLVKRRVKKPKVESDVTYNLDRDKNVYRQSIDSNTLRFLSSINLDTHRWSKKLGEHNAMDWLSLEKGRHNRSFM